MVFWRGVAFEINQSIPNYVVERHMLHIIINVWQKKNLISHPFLAIYS